MPTPSCPRDERDRRSVTGQCAVRPRGYRYGTAPDASIRTTTWPGPGSRHRSGSSMHQHPLAEAGHETAAHAMGKLPLRLAPATPPAGDHSHDDRRTPRRQYGPRNLGTARREPRVLEPAPCLEHPDPVALLGQPQRRYRGIPSRPPARHSHTKQQTRSYPARLHHPASAHDALPPAMPEGPKVPERLRPAAGRGSTRGPEAHWVAGAGTGRPGGGWSRGYARPRRWRRRGGRSRG